MTSKYQELAAINVAPATEKKNGLTYLPWASAVDFLLRSDPNANWQYGEVVWFGETAMVSCAVTAHGVTRTAHLPVMDHRNKSIVKPDSFAVNTAMQRCLTKAIALHGLGLFLYMGEDLPREDPDVACDALKALAESKNYDLQGLFDRLNVKSLQELTQAQRKQLESKLKESA